MICIIRTEIGMGHNGITGFWARMEILLRSYSLVGKKI